MLSQNGTADPRYISCKERYARRRTS
ncbi:14 kDa lytic protein splice variant A [Gallid alphaherpesvirus 2]|nr:14 kDa lytic protein splice variant A [Gallid alphaherpesvirus 2]AQN77866.1 14 kDa lytic protein splice variant A [Gallid alphaherpesvirus 2]AQN77939.1 14 kDa lytic protein splice variant A [Gallid alphaherpesvirus 2]AQN78039.1 14 kDa lytic protein splice variant A [Gallid alphaherpesvirus 2]AVI57739.1 14 kDa lytic protein splice variant A [Gallid alphaherpesvirus 2]